MSDNNQRVKKHYVYGHYTNENVLFYIGVGTILNLKTNKHISRYSRAYHRANRTKFWNNVVSKHGLKVKILYQFYTKQEALEKELELISKFGRRCMNNGILCNISSGGEIGPVGRKFIMSEQQKKKLFEIKSMSYYIYNAQTGKYMITLLTLKSVAKFCGVTQNAISNCLKTKNYTNDFFVFKDYKGLQLDFTVKDLDFKSTLSKKVITINVETNIKTTYNSIAEASIGLNTDRTNLKKGLKNNRIVKKHKVFFEGSISSQDL
jgi:hypothetical protein